MLSLLTPPITSVPLLSLLMPRALPRLTKVLDSSHHIIIIIINKQPHLHRSIHSSHSITLLLLTKVTRQFNTETIYIVHDEVLFSKISQVCCFSSIIFTQNSYFVIEAYVHFIPHLMNVIVNSKHSTKLLSPSPSFFRQGQCIHSRIAC